MPSNQTEIVDFNEYRLRKIFLGQVMNGLLEACDQDLLDLDFLNGMRLRNAMTQQLIELSGGYRVQTVLTK